MRVLSQAVHTLQDASSPAHYDFQPAWENSWSGMAENSSHYTDENFYPGDYGMAANDTRRIWSYFTGAAAMPSDFFLDLYDTPNGPVFRPMFSRSPKEVNAIVTKRSIILLAVIVGVTSLAITWILTAHASPFYHYFSANPSLLNLWLGLNTLVLLIITVFDLPDGVGYFLIFLQWFLIAYVPLSLAKVFMRHSRVNEDRLS